MAVRGTPSLGHRINYSTIARIAWFFLATVLVGMHIGGIQPYYEVLTTICGQEPCTALRLNAQDAELLESLGLSLHAYALYHIGLETLVSTGLALLGGLFIWRMAHTWLGIVLAFTLLLFGFNFMIETDAAFVSQNPAFQIPFDISSALTTILFLVLFFIFPDGRLIPRWGWLVLLVLTAVSILDPILRGFGLVTPSGQFNTVFLFLFTISLFAGVYAQIYRYRNVSSPLERQQTKWVIFGLILLVVGIMTYTFFVEIYPPQSSQIQLAFNLGIYSLLVPVILFFPVTFAISIFRYRLWDIDLIVRRTLLYALVTGLLVMIYFGGVTVLQTFFITVTGQQSPLVVVFSTLLIAALFNPLRSRIQAFIDRRFYRSSYNAQQILERFSTHARKEVELRNLTFELARAAHESLQPDAVSLWLRKST